MVARVLSEKALSAAFGALSDPTRRAILTRLAAGPASVAELAEPFQMTQPAISRHLKVLEHAGLISTRADAQRRLRRVEPRRVTEVTEWLEGYRQMLTANFARLDALLESMQANSTDNDGATQ